jgi:hypothetical protein
MKKARPTSDPDEMQAEYDFRGGIRGKYASRYPVVVLDPDVAAGFEDAEAVNAALRALLKDRSKQNCD